MLASGAGGLRGSRAWLGHAPGVAPSAILTASHDKEHTLALRHRFAAFSRLHCLDVPPTGHCEVPRHEALFDLERGGDAIPGQRGLEDGAYRFTALDGRSAGGPQDVVICQQ
jgi:hypothetical protein